LQRVANIGRVSFGVNVRRRRFQRKADVASDFFSGNSFPD